MMLTTDLSLRWIPIYAPIAKRFHENPDQLADAFARRWFKLLHRDMGPRSRYLGPGSRAAAVAGPVPPVDHELIGEQDVAALKRKILDSGLSVPELVSTAWGCGQLPRHRQARRRQRRAHPPRAAEGLGGQRAAALAKVLRPSSGSSRTSTARSPAARRSRWPT
jgi:catalase (peroxidase I)